MEPITIIGYAVAILIGAVPIAHLQMANLAEVNALLNSPLAREASGEDLIRRPEVTYAALTQIEPFAPAIDDKEATEQVEISIKYQGYIEHQQPLS